MNYFVFFERRGFLYISFLFGSANKTIKYRKKEKEKKIWRNVLFEVTEKGIKSHCFR